LSPCSTPEQMHRKATNTQNLQADYSGLSTPALVNTQIAGADKP